MQAQFIAEPGASSDDDNSGSDSDSDDSDASQGGTTLGGTLANLSLTNGDSTTAGGVALASPAPSKTSIATPPHLRKAPASATSGNSKFAKVRPEPRKEAMDLAQRERDRERELEDDVEVASSDSDSD